MKLEKGAVDSNGKLRVDIFLGIPRFKVFFGLTSLFFAIIFLLQEWIGKSLCF